MPLARAPVVALVPVRSPGAGKTRLAAGLSRTERAALSSAMLADVVAALRASPVDRVVVAASGPSAASAATALGCDVTRDPPSARGLNGALRAASSRLGTVGSLLVVMADLPRLRPADVAQVLEVDAQVVVAATEDGGTGGLLRQPPGVIRTAYGEQSAVRHIRLAHRARVTATTVHVGGFAHDVDTIEDLKALDHGPLGPTTSAFLDAIRSRLEDAG